MFGKGNDFVVTALTENVFFFIRQVWHNQMYETGLGLAADKLNNAMMYLFSILEKLQNLLATPQFVKCVS